MTWGGNPAVQNHYKAGRLVQEVRVNEIEGVCACGYLTLNPATSFENHNGGLTVKRSRVRIVRDDGSVVKALRGKGINRYGSCNACVNKWT